MPLGCPANKDSPPLAQNEPCKVKTVAFFGNCQLESIQAIFFAVLPGHLTTSLVRPIHKIEPGMFDSFCDQLARCDRIYTHFLSERHGPYAYVNLKAMFGEKLFLVPNLECEGYCPQIAYLDRDTRLPDLDYVDFRLLELFLDKVSLENAIAVYHDCDVDKHAIERILHRRIGRYLAHHVQGEVIFDYSRRLAETYNRGRLFYTFNHPTASEMEWVANNLLAHLELPIRVSLGPAPRMVPPMLTAVGRALGISSDLDDTITCWGRSVTLRDYASAYYAEFAKIDRARLREACANSLWAQCRSPRRATLRLPAV